MPIFSAFVLFAFIWFLTLLAVLPLRMKTQGEAGSVTHGTPQSAPANPQIRGKMIVTTIIATCLWAVVVWVIVSGALTVESMDFVNRWING